MHRSIILGEDIRRFSSITQYLYGQSTARYLQYRSVTAPKGRLGRALSLIREALREVETASTGIVVNADLLTQDTVRKLQSAAADAGYLSARRLLAAYGYTVPAKRSALTAIVKLSDDVPTAKASCETKLSEYAERKISYIKLLPLVRSIPDFKEKTFVLTGYYNDYYQNALYELIPKRGGHIRSCITGKTDYLIVYDCYGITKRMKDAVMQKENKNHVINMVFFEDIADTLGIRLAPYDRKSFEEFKQEVPDYDKLYSEITEVGDYELTGDYDTAEIATVVNSEDKLAVEPESFSDDAAEHTDITDNSIGYENAVSDTTASSCESVVSDQTEDQSAKNTMKEQEEKQEKEVDKIDMISVMEQQEHNKVLGLSEEMPIECQVNVSSESETSNVQTNTKKKEGCYIATAVYGSYNAPQVRVLRKYRDEVLKKSILGRAFIKVYYALSPPVADKLKNARRLNRFVRKMLDKWIRRLSRDFQDK